MPMVAYSLLCNSLICLLALSKPPAIRSTAAPPILPDSPGEDPAGESRRSGSFPSPLFSSSVSSPVPSLPSLSSVPLLLSSSSLVSSSLPLSSTLLLSSLLPSPLPPLSTLPLLSPLSSTSSATLFSPSGSLCSNSPVIVVLPEVSVFSLPLAYSSQRSAVCLASAALSPKTC